MASLSCHLYPVTPPDPLRSNNRLLVLCCVASECDDVAQGDMLGDALGMLHGFRDILEFLSASRTQLCGAGLVTRCAISVPSGNITTTDV